jgi:hypothetical protein
MLLFDEYSKVYEEKWDKIKQEVFNFDHAYYLWKLRTLKFTEWRMGRRFEKEIMEK